MGKNNIRRKGGTAQVTLLGDPENPRVFGVPVTNAIMELMCPECLEGVMRPKSEGITGADGKARTIVHACSNECGFTESIEMPPWPRPHTVPQVGMEKALQVAAHHYRMRTAGPNVEQFPTPAAPEGDGDGVD